MTKGTIGDRPDWESGRVLDEFADECKALLQKYAQYGFTFAAVASLYDPLKEETYTQYWTQGRFNEAIGALYTTLRRLTDD